MEERGSAPSIGPVPEQAAAAGPQVLRPLPVEDDLELDADFECLAAAVEAGRVRVPEEWELEGPAVSVSLGDASDLDPALLAAMCGPTGLGGESLSPMYGQDKAADVLRPGPVLSALTEQAVADLAVLADDQLVGVLSAARRLESRAAYLQTLAIAEFARRREAEREAAKSRKVPLHCRPGQFPGEELAEMQAPSQMQTGPRLESRAAGARRPPLDRPLWSQLHNSSQYLRSLNTTIPWPSLHVQAWTSTRSPRCARASAGSC